MGGNQSVVDNVNIMNEINSSISSRIDNINKITNNITNKTIGKFTQNQRSSNNVNCSTKNTIKISNCHIDIEGDADLSWNQDGYANCVSEMMSQLKSNTTMQELFSTELQSELKQAVESDQSFQQSLDAKNFLSNLDTKGTVDNLVDQIAGTVSNAFDDITGTSTSESNVTSVSNKVSAHFDSKIYNEYDVKNTVEKELGVDISSNQQFNCHFSGESGNTIEFDNCDFFTKGNFNYKLNQSSAVKTLQTCVTDQIATDVILDKFGASISNKGESTATNKQEGDQDEHADTTIKDTTKVNLFGMDFDVKNLLMGGALFMFGLMFMFFVFKMMSRHKSHEHVSPYPYQMMPPPMMSPQMMSPPMMPPQMMPPPMGPPQ
jgi:hypothetical protein